jgi:hypothetical protein
MTTQADWWAAVTGFARDPGAHEQRCLWLVMELGVHLPGPAGRGSPRVLTQRQGNGQDGIGTARLRGRPETPVHRAFLVSAGFALAGAVLAALLITTRDSRQHSDAARSITANPAVT